jgi:SynChlorMet cassette protein ScmD
MLREEFDDWAVLFDPDSGHGFGLSPTSVFLWKLLDGEHTLGGLLAEIRRYVDNVPEDARDHIDSFVDTLIAEGLAGLDSDGSDFLDHAGTVRLYQEKCTCVPLGTTGGMKTFKYEPPRLINLNSEERAIGKCCNNGSHDTNDCFDGACASACHSGCNATTQGTCLGCGSCADWSGTACNSNGAAAGGMLCSSCNNFGSHISCHCAAGI